MPRRDCVYLGDTARVPYSRKPPEMVAGFAMGIADFLCGSGVEGLVVECNTASAVALPRLTGRCAVPVWGVIDARVEAATRATRSGRVGVIGTAGTIRSGAYQRRLSARGCEVWAQACPMLVHVVEEGLADSAEAEILARRTVHFVTGDPIAFGHTAAVVGGSEGEIPPLPATELEAGREANYAGLARCYTNSPFSR